MPTANPVVLRKFRAAFDALYGDRIERVALYGSRVRGDARPDSDYDVAMFLKELDDRWAEADTIAVATADILSETGAVIHAIPIAQVSTEIRLLCTNCGARDWICDAGSVPLPGKSATIFFQRPRRSSVSSGC